MFTIGDFAKLGRVSVRMLRHYDAIGLLRPAAVLRAGLTAADAADVLWTLTAPEVPLRLVHRRGWSLDKYEAWLADTMARALLAADR